MILVAGREKRRRRANAAFALHAPDFIRVLEGVVSPVRVVLVRIVRVPRPVRGGDDEHIANAETVAKLLHRGERGVYRRARFDLPRVRGVWIFWTTSETVFGRETLDHAVDVRDGDDAGVFQKHRGREHGHKVPAILEVGPVRAHRPTHGVLRFLFPILGGGALEDDVEADGDDHARQRREYDAVVRRVSPAFAVDFAVHAHARRGDADEVLHVKLALSVWAEAFAERAQAPYRSTFRVTQRERGAAVRHAKDEIISREILVVWVVRADDLNVFRFSSIPRELALALAAGVVRPQNFAVGDGDEVHVSIQTRHRDDGVLRIRDASAGFHAPREVRPPQHLAVERARAHDLRAVRADDDPPRAVAGFARDAKHERARVDAPAELRVPDVT
eukprot:31210-Pelagococcus_subviridis.AAC.15